MALDAAGIVRLDVSSQLTLYDDRLNLHGIINTLERYGHTLYVGTSTGLSRLHRPASAAKRRLPVLVDVLEGLPTTALIATDSILFVATHEGLYALRDGEPEPLEGGTFFALLESRRFPGQIWVGQKKGLARLAYRSTGGWRLETVYEGKTPGDHIRSILEEHDGTLWLGAADGTIQRLLFSGEPSTFVRESLTKEDGLPEDFFSMASVDGAVVFVSEQGIYRFDGEAEDGAKFYRDPSLLAASGSSSRPLRLFNQDDDGRLWAIYEDHVDIAVAQADGSYLYQTPAVLHFSKSMVNFYAEADGVAWISDGDRLVRYDAGVEQDYTAGFAALLRRVVATRTERVIYGGAPITGEETLLSLRHEDHDVRFEVSAPSYNDIRATRYQFYLEGYDETWSAWTPRTSRTYNDLVGGSYRLRVRARNGQGVLSAEAVFVFDVLPPWYRTWAAYLLYLVMMLAALAFSWHHYQVVQENRRAQIRETEWRAEATALQLQAAEAQARALQAENRRQEVELEKAREKAHLVEQLKRSNQELEQFASVASHDLREPLRTIRSFVQLLENRYQGRLDDADTFIGYIVDGTDRMQALIRDILALSRVGRQEVEHQPVDMSVVLKRTLADIQTALEEAKAEITYDPLPTVEGDATQLGLVLQNLISNGVKFRGEAAPHVHISALRRNGTWCFGVRDNGIGIKEEFQEKIFEVFKRLHSRSDYEGTGIGLAICKKIVEQHGGRIWVESQEGQSTTFYFMLPA